VRRKVISKIIAVKQTDSSLNKHEGIQKYRVIYFNFSTYILKNTEKEWKNVSDKSLYKFKEQQIMVKSNF